MPYLHDVIRAIRDTTMADINNLNSGNSSSSYNNYPVSNNQNIAKVNPAAEGAEYSHSWKRMPRPFGLNARVPQAPVVGERTQVLAQKIIKDLVMAPVKPVLDYFKNNENVFNGNISAEIERNLIAERTTEALKRRKAEGKTLGRPKGRKNSNLKLADKENDIRRMLNDGYTKTYIIDYFHISSATLYNFLKARGIKY